MEVARLKEQGKEITLAVIQVGQTRHLPFMWVIRKSYCEYIGIKSLAYELDEETRQGRVGCTC